MPEANFESLQSSNLETTQRELGAKILSQANFEARHKPIVDSSFEKARKRGEKLLGKNNERRNDAYISRLEELVKTHGNHLEKKLWQTSASKLIIKSDDITDDYWRSQEQILRDNGRNYKLNDYAKQRLVDNIQKNQRESLQPWSDYLGSEKSPYPMWFKVYAWDGMSKMGVFDKNKQRFAKRDKHTVAPYPKLNPAALAKVYGIILDFYGQTEQGRQKEKIEHDKKLEVLVESGNFNELYSKVLLNEKASPKTPEKTEDIRGRWVEYLPGDEEELAVAAEGTPWCIANPGTGRKYLGPDDSYYDEYEKNDDIYDKYADYERDFYNDRYDRYDDYPHNSHDSKNNTRERQRNKAKFILFHLIDPRTNNLSVSACASIRLGSDGNVAEISGLKEGQALEDSLVPIVEEKVLSLPGGKKFLVAFADKKQLIALDRKMHKHEDLTKEELEFIYEIHQPIKFLGTHEVDFRIDELKEAYGVEYALDHGLSVDVFIPILSSDDVASNLDSLISHGADIDINNLVSNLSRKAIASNLDSLISHGADIDINNLVPYLSDFDKIQNLDELISHGADINNLVSNLSRKAIASNLDSLISHGADIDINNLVSYLSPRDIVDNLDSLISHGAEIDINDLILDLEEEGREAYNDACRNQHFPSYDDYDDYDDYEDDEDYYIDYDEYNYVAKHLNILLSHGADAGNLVPYLSDFDKIQNLDELISHGADINNLVSNLSRKAIASNLDSLISHGADIDINNLVSYLSPRDIVDNLDSLISHGAEIDINSLASQLHHHYIIKNLNTLLSHGADHRIILSHLSPNEINENFDALRRYGVNIW